jgi:hypothetical protein
MESAAAERDDVAALPAVVSPLALGGLVVEGGLVGHTGQVTSLQ